MVGAPFAVITASMTFTSPPAFGGYQYITKLQKSVLISVLQQVGILTIYQVMKLQYLNVKFMLNP